MQIIREDIDSRHGQFVATIDGVPGKAVLTYTRQGPDVISADHTIVPDQMAGKGVATALVKHMVTAAEEKGMMIVPICSFVQVQYKRHPEWERHFTSAPNEKPTL